LTWMMKMRRRTRTRTRMRMKMLVWRRTSRLHACIQSSLPQVWMYACHVAVEGAQPAGNGAVAPGSVPPKSSS
jgi:hypothetical protein